MQLPTLKRRESVRDAVRRRVGLTTLTRRDTGLAVKAAQCIVRDARA